MYKLLLLLIVSSLLFLPACSEDETSGSKEVDNHPKTDAKNNSTHVEEDQDQDLEEGSLPPSESEETSDEQQKENEDEQFDSGVQDKSDDSQVNKNEDKFSLLRPKGETLRAFAEKDQTLFTEEIVDQNQKFVQILVTLGSTQTTEIYKWTAEEITLVYQEYTDAEQNKKSIIDDFEPNIQEERILGDRTDWDILNENATVSLNGTTYKGVYVVKTVSDEIVGSETLKTRYYAPGHGLIKEEIEVTGENGYTSTVSLKN
ncbi:hypothetical protein ACRTEV_20465 [Rossellomorea arthrocnemi]